MVSDSYLSVSQNASVSLTRTKVSVSVSETSVSSKKSNSDEDEKIDLNVAANMADRLKEAKTPDEMFALLKEGQQQAREALDKFNALAEQRLGGEGVRSVQDYNNLVFDAVRSVVEDLLTEQASRQVTQTSVEVSVEVVQISFEARLSMAIRERDPQLADQLEKEPDPSRA